MPATKQHNLFEKKTTVPSRGLRLSPTTGLGLFNNCPRCFWIHYNEGVHRPRGIFPSLPGGMDLVIKDYFDGFRGGLPPELEGKIDGELFEDVVLLNKWRNWRTGMEYHDKELDATLFGALDDCLKIGDAYGPLDYKTKGSAPVDGDSERYYQTQLDVYALLLRENGFAPADHGFLVYYYPKKVGENGVVTFEVQPVRLAVDADRAHRVFAAAVKTLRGPMPKRHTNCEYCVWNEQLSEFD